MATLDWSQCPAVESIAGKVTGAWVFKDTRMPVSLVFENLEAGATIDEIMEWFHLTRSRSPSCWNSRREASIHLRHRCRPGPQRYMRVLFDHSTPAPLRYAL